MSYPITSAADALNTARAVLRATAGWDDARVLSAGGAAARDSGRLTSAALSGVTDVMSTADSVWRGRGALGGRAVPSGEPRAHVPMSIVHDGEPVHSRSLSGLRGTRLRAGAVAQTMGSPDEWKRRYADASAAAARREKELNEQLEASVRLCEDMQAALDSAKVDVEDAETRAGRAQQEAGELRRALREHEASLRAANLQLVAQARDLHSQEVKIQELMADVAAGRQDYARLQQELSSLSATRTHERVGDTASGARVAALESQLARASSDATRHASECASLEQEVQSMRQALLTSEVERSALLSQNAQLSVRAQDAEAQVAATVQKMDAVVSGLQQQLRSALSEAETTQAQLRKELHEAQRHQRTDAQQRALAERRATELQKQYDDASAQVLRMRDDVVALRTELSREQHELASCRSAGEAARKELTALVEDHTRNSILQQERHDADIALLQGTNDRQCNDLRQRLDEAVAARDAANESLSRQLRAQTERHDAEVAAIHSAHVAAEKQHEREREQWSTTVQQQKARLEHLESALNDANEELAKRGLQLQGTESALHAKNAELQSHSNLLARSEDRIQQLQLEVQRYRAQIELLKGARDELETRSAQAERLVSSLRLAEQRKGEALIAAEARVLAVQQSAAAEAERAATRSADLERELRDTRVALDAAEDRARSSQSDLVAKLRQIEDLQAVVDSHRQQASARESQLAEEVRAVKEQSETELQRARRELETQVVCAHQELQESREREILADQRASTLATDVRQSRDAIDHERRGRESAEATNQRLERHILQLETQLQAATQQLREMDAARRAKDDSQSALQRKLSECELVIAEAMQERDRARNASQSSTADASRLQQLCDELQQQRSEDEQAMRNMKGLIDSLRAQLQEQAEASRVELERALQQAADRGSREVESVSHIAQEQVLRAASTITALQARVEDLDNQNRGLSEQVAAARREADELASKLALASQNVQQLQDERDLSAQQVRTAEEGASLLRREVQLQLDAAQRAVSEQQAASAQRESGLLSQISALQQAAVAATEEHNRELQELREAAREQLRTVRRQAEAQASEGQRLLHAQLDAASVSLQAAQRQLVESQAAAEVELHRLRDTHDAQLQQLRESTEARRQRDLYALRTQLQDEYETALRALREEMAALRTRDDRHRGPSSPAPGRTPIRTQSSGALASRLQAMKTQHSDTSGHHGTSCTSTRAHENSLPAAEAPASLDPVHDIAATSSPALGPAQRQFASPGIAAVFAEADSAVAAAQRFLRPSQQSALLPSVSEASSAPSLRPLVHADNTPGSTAKFATPGHALRSSVRSPAPAAVSVANALASATPAAAVHPASMASPASVVTPHTVVSAVSSPADDLSFMISPSPRAMDRHRPQIGGPSPDGAAALSELQASGDYSDLDLSDDEPVGSELQPIPEEDTEAAKDSTPPASMSPDVPVAPREDPSPPLSRAVAKRPIIGAGVGISEQVQKAATLLQAASTLNSALELATKGPAAQLDTPALDADLDAARNKLSRAHTAHTRYEGASHQEKVALAGTFIVAAQQAQSSVRGAAQALVAANVLTREQLLSVRMRVGAEALSAWELVEGGLGAVARAMYR